MSLIQYKVAILGSGSSAGTDKSGLTTGPYTAIKAKGVCQRVEITECPADGFTGTFTRVGLNYVLGPQWDAHSGDAAANVQGLPAEIGAQILLNDYIEEGNSGARAIGHPDIQSSGMPGYNPATTLCRIASATSGTTTVLVREFS